MRPPTPLCLLLLPLLAACASAHSPYSRVTADDGRAYYARVDLTFRSEAGGFLTFKDLVTKEDVKLKNGTYAEEECSSEEVEYFQRRYIEDPDKKPMASDMRPPPR
jgi:hypothetical protein